MSMLPSSGQPMTEHNTNKTTRLLPSAQTLRASLIHDTKNFQKPIENIDHIEVVLHLPV